MDNENTIFDAEIEEEKAEKINGENTPVVQMPRPFLTWAVNGKEYKLKLTTKVITKLESQLRQNLLDAIVDEGIPRMSVVVPLLQGALTKFQHGIKSDDVADMIDDYMSGGHTVIDLLRDVIYPLMADAGFFTRSMMEMMQEEMSDIDANL